MMSCSIAPSAATALPAIALGLTAPVARLRAVRAALLPAALSRARGRGAGRGSGGGTRVGRDLPIRDVSWGLRAHLARASARLAVQPIHVAGSPVASHEDHALLEGTGLVHGVQLVAGAHGQHHALGALLHDSGDLQSTTLQLVPLGEVERLAAVDGGSAVVSEHAGGGLHLGVAPLVALPVAVTNAAVVVGASVVRDLLNLRVAFVHVPLCTAAETVEALAVAVVVVVLTSGGRGHVDHVEVDVAAASGL
mmetsp:Transcript_86081/g.180021  ORF Transcript_86081/g.180021 Transcript_86081/m.180021 type:complete len:251 (-) Transcript_86081:586-1338(-)